MRYHLILLAALLAPAAPATAQVTVDLRALDALPATHHAAPVPHHFVATRHAPAEAMRKPVPPRPVAASKPARQPVSVASTHAAAGPAAAPAVAAGPNAKASAEQTEPGGAAAKPAKVAAAAPPPLPTMDAAPPAVAQIPPVQPPASHGAAPQPATQTGATKAAAVSTGLKVSFPAGEAALSSESAAAIKQLVASAHGDASATYNVVAYAAGESGDPSIARRMSLSRALAVRNALMADGVDSTRIYVRAMGSNVPSGPADRVDVTLLGGNNPAR